MDEQVQVATIVKVYPTRVWSEKDIMGTVHIKMQHEGCEPFDFIQIQYDYAYTHNSHQAYLTEQILKLLGAPDSATAEQK